MHEMDENDAIQDMDIEIINIHQTYDKNIKILEKTENIINPIAKTSKKIDSCKQNNNSNEIKEMEIFDGGTIIL